MADAFKVLHVIDSLREGGAESLLYYFLKSAIDNTNLRCDVCTLYAGGGFESKVRQLGIKVFCLGLQNKYSLSGIPKMMKMISSSAYDIVHTHLFPASGYVAMASILNRKPTYVHTEHSENNRRRTMKVFKVIDRLQYRPFKLVIAVGKSTRSELDSWLPELSSRLRVIENAVPVNEIHEAGTRAGSQRMYDMDVIFVGRLTEAKGVDCLLRAVAIAQRKLGKPIKTCIVGDGPLKAQLENLAISLGLNEVCFVTPQENIYEWMACSRVIALPSRWEGLPMVLLEAMAIMRPAIIATPVGGMKDVLEDNASGILVSVDDAQQLASAICCLLEDEDLRNRLAHEAFRIAKEKYDIERMVEQTLSLYRLVTRLDN